MADKKDNIVLSIRDMSKSFGRNRVLTRINLDVKAGNSYGLWGKRRWKINDDEVSFRNIPEGRRKIFLNGKEISFSGPKDALETGSQWFIRN